MERWFYSAQIKDFITAPTQEIWGILAKNNDFSLEINQKEAWSQEIKILKENLKDIAGQIFFEYSIPRMGRRIDVILLIKNVIFILEFKVGEKEFLASAIDQVWDYALDLSNFHGASHNNLIAPILIATKANNPYFTASIKKNDRNIFSPIKTNGDNLLEVIKEILQLATGKEIDIENWKQGNYSPTPTIIEAATALYNGHSVTDISRCDAEATNLSKTSDAVLKIIENSKNNKEKVICFVTGVPGAGKTLVGLNIATKYGNVNKKSGNVYLSGNGPLVAVLREALTRDRVIRERNRGNRVKKGTVFSAVKSFIQNVHNFRDDCLINLSSPPFEHVAIFDEAQRAWNHNQTANFMLRRKKVPNFSYSEPEFLISCLDRHKDWAVVICLVGGGQEINTGEAGISEWISAVNRSFCNWKVYISDRLTESEYATKNAIELLENKTNIIKKRNYIWRFRYAHLGQRMSRCWLKIF